MLLHEWIYDNTSDCRVVVEFGAMFFERLALVHPSVGRKIGIEIHAPYLNRAEYDDCIKILGDMRQFEQWIAPEDMDCAMFVDSLEHLTREDGVSLIRRIKSRFRKILLMVPEGNHPQTVDVFSMGADAYQTHRSTWRVNDVEGLGFQSVLFDPLYFNDPNFRAQGKDPGCIFAIWRRMNKKIFI